MEPVIASILCLPLLPSGCESFSNCKSATATLGAAGSNDQAGTGTKTGEQS